MAQRVSVVTLSVGRTPVLAGPALSLRRPGIEHGKCDTAIVSPSGIGGFIEASLSGDPAIELMWPGAGHVRVVGAPTMPPAVG